MEFAIDRFWRSPGNVRRSAIGKLEKSSWKLKARYRETGGWQKRRVRKKNSCWNRRDALWCLGLHRFNKRSPLLAFALRAPFDSTRLRDSSSHPFKEREREGVDGSTSPPGLACYFANESKRLLFRGSGSPKGKGVGAKRRESMLSPLSSASPLLIARNPRDFFATRPQTSPLAFVEAWSHLASLALLSP